MSYLLLVLGALGHVVLWVALVNRLHAIAIRRRWMDALTAGCGIAVAVVPLGVALAVYPLPHDWPNGLGVFEAAAWVYLSCCAVLFLVGAGRWWRLQRHPERRGIVFANHTAHFRPADESDTPLAGPGIPRLLARLPWNQALEICIQQKQLCIPRLSSRYDGVRIAHLSDLHMSGRITKAYFEKAVEHVNRCEPDLIAITGDLVERSMCLDWIPETLGRLRAPAGIYYVLGNHDRHVDERRLHAALADAGLIHIGGQWRNASVRNLPLVLAGNALPWYPPAPDLSDCPPHDGAGLPLRILLTHSPDLFTWAQEHEIDLMLAGHNHGGQVRLPVVGAILAPSLHGTRYSAGAFQANDTVMHVSRGTSCLTPIRFNCPPEIAILILRAAN